MRKAGGIFVVALAASLAVTALAAAELSQKGGLFVRFDGGISPKALPRRAPAPIAVSIEGTVRALKSSDPPALSRIQIALNRGGQLDTRGLPVCNRGQLSSTNVTEALAACGDALVGAGGIVAQTSFPDQPHHTLRGEVTLFNGREHGRPTILAHVFQASPGPLTDVITFEVRRTGGAFGTVITGRMPPALEHNGYLTSIFLRLRRTYVYRGRQHSYLSAACPAPPGLSGALFPFAKASMTFDDGRTLSSTLTRTCRAKG